MKFMIIKEALAMQLAKKYPKGDCDFVSHKRKNAWYGLFEDESLLAICKILEITKKEARLCNDFVLPDYRGKKLHSALISFREGVAKRMKYEKVSTISKLNYEKYGYQKVKHYPKRNAWLWEKEI